MKFLSTYKVFVRENIVIVFPKNILFCLVFQENIASFLKILYLCPNSVLKYLPFYRESSAFFYRESSAFFSQNLDYFHQFRVSQENISFFLLHHYYQYHQSAFQRSFLTNHVFRENIAIFCSHHHQMKNVFQESIACASLCRHSNVYL